MAQRGNNAALMDVPSKPRMEEFVTHMARYLNYAAAMGVPIMSRRVDFV